MHLPNIAVNFGKYLLTLPIRVLIMIPLFVVVVLFWRINLGKSIVMEAPNKDFAQWAVMMPVRLTLGALIVAVGVLIGDIDI
jgi:hypothetical protein